MALHTGLGMKCGMGPDLHMLDLAVWGPGVLSPLIRPGKGSTRSQGPDPATWSHVEVVQRLRTLIPLCLGSSGPNPGTQG